MPDQADAGATGAEVDCVATFYQFARVADPDGLCAAVQRMAETAQVKGTVLIAAEGINGTLTGSRASLESVVAALQSRSEFSQMPVKYSSADQDNPVFHRLKIRHKSEIVAMGLPGVTAIDRTGTHVGPDQWHELLDDPSVPVIDVRNRYETRVGQFVGATDPDTQSFREFPAYAAEHLDPDTTPRVAMYCTGGIRCEKASAYLLQQGFEEVYQLDGGVLNYLAQVDAQQSQWQGECFVFDQRVSVNQSLEQGDYVQCFACRSALTKQDQESEHYVEGRSCPYCHADLSPAQRASFAERQKQMALAQARGTDHIGAQYLSSKDRSSKHPSSRCDGD